MLLQALILLLSCFPTALCQVVLERVNYYIWENVSSLYIEGTGLELTAKHLLLEIGAIGQELVRDKDYTVENLGRKGLKIALLTQWIDFTQTTSPESLVLKSVRYEGFSQQFLPYPQVIATVFRIPTLLPSDQMIYAIRSQVLRIDGTNLKGLQGISLSFSNTDNYCSHHQFSNIKILTSTFPLHDDFLSLENFEPFRYFQSNNNNELRIFGICSHDSSAS